MGSNLSRLLRARHDRGGRERSHGVEVEERIVDKFPDKEATALYWPVTDSYVLTRQAGGKKYLFYRGAEVWEFDVQYYNGDFVPTAFVASKLEIRKMNVEEISGFLQACEERLNTGGEEMEARDQFKMLLNAAWEAASELQTTA